MFPIRIYRNKFLHNRALGFSWVCYSCGSLIWSKKVLEVFGFQLHWNPKCWTNIYRVRRDYLKRAEDFWREFE